MNSEGVARLVSVDGVDGELTLAILPDTGCEWIVCWGYIFHNDGAGAHNINIRWVDSNPIRVGTPITINFPTASLAANLNMALNAWRPDVSVANITHHPEPLIITHNVHPTAVTDAIAAGKHLAARLMVIERGGIGS